VPQSGDGHESAHGRRPHSPPRTPSKACAFCGQVTTGDICAFCKLADQIKRHAVPPDADRVVE